MTSAGYCGRIYDNKSKGDDVTAKIRSTFKRTILIIIAAGMIAGLCCPAVSDGSYDAVHGLGGYKNVMSVPSLPAVSDFIADNSAQVDLTRFLNEKNRSGRQVISGPDNTGRADFRSSDILSFDLCIFLLCVLFGTSVFSFKHIFYIHLKDGNK